MSKLIKSVSIEALLSQRNAMVDRLRKAAALLTEVTELSQSALGNDDAVPRLECRRAHVSFPHGLDVMIRHVDAAAWNHLMAESGLRTLMDAEARAKWDSSIYERKVPELTRESIEATFRELYDARQVMFERGVVAAFRKLSWDYKTNNPCLFGKRIIVEYLLDTWANGGKRYVSGPSHGGANKLDDLIRVMSVLDGKPEPDHRQGSFHALNKAIGYDRPPTSEPIELHDLISVRCFKNGNGHVTFLRQDLVTRLNEIVAKHHSGALPPAR
jgi:hypothetical protein